MARKKFVETGGATPDSGSLPGTALETMGETHDVDFGQDAVHIATVSVEAGDRLFPGQHVGLDEDLRATTKTKDLLGIVDPFINGQIFPGTRFWLFLYPRTITSLRHAWTHPGYDEAVKNSTVNKLKNEIEESKVWLEDFANSMGFSYSTLMEALENGNNDYATVYGSDASGEIPESLWPHYERVTGRKRGEHDEPKYFSCSC